jgi:hypothetical protein
MQDFGSARFYVFLRFCRLARLRRSTNGKDFIMVQRLWLMLKGQEQPIRG